MAQLIDHLADLTGFRDRDLLDVTIVRAIKDVLQPLSVSIFRCVGDFGAQHWLTRARIGPGDLTVTADPPWTEIATLPPLDDMPARRDCLINAEMITVGETPQTSIFPISTEREVVGVLELETAQPLTPADRATVCTVLRIYGNFHDLLDHSERDPLTGLLNRQTFDTAFTTRAPRRSVTGEITTQGRRCEQETPAVWLGVVDIDHFKRVNDTFGHLIGDEVLLLLSRLLRSSFRHHDRLYRFGGEEFVVVLSCLRADQAALAFERLRHNVELFDFPQVGRITVSIGFALANTDETPSAAFARADKALYHAKGHERNQVAYYGDLVSDGAIVETRITGDIELF